MVCWPRTEANIIYSFTELPDPTPTRVRSILPPPTIDFTTPWAFFDGAANQIGCGGGFLLHRNENHRFKVQMGLGVGSNNFAEIMALRNLLHFSLEQRCQNLNIYGDSKTVVNWFNLITTCHIYTLSNIMYEIQTFKAAFNHISCLHIYREHNNCADQLSKEALALPRGEWIILEQQGSEEYRFFHRLYTYRRAQ